MTFWRALDKAFQQKIATAEDFIASGGCKDFPDYRGHCARVETFKEARDIVRETIETYGLEEAEEEDGG